MAVFDWCLRGRHAQCRRRGEVLVTGVGKAPLTTREVLCGCSDSHCPCSKNTPADGVQEHPAVV